MVRVCIFPILIGFFWSEATPIVYANEVYFKACENYQSGQYRECKEMDDIEYGRFGTTVIHIYGELIWKPSVPRVQSDIFLRWIFRSPQGEEELVVSHSDSPAYRWRPSRVPNITRWRVQLTVWRDNLGTYVFQAFTDQSAPEGSLIEEILIPVVAGEG